MVLNCHELFICLKTGTAINYVIAKLYITLIKQLIIGKNNWQKRFFFCYHLKAMQKHVEKIKKLSDHRQQVKQTI